MAPSLPTSLRSLLWHARIEERESSELGLLHVPRCKALDLEARQGGRVAPRADVYRRLRFFLDHGFYKIESRNAYAPSERLGHAHHGAPLLCEKCGRSDEIEGVKLDRLLREAGCPCWICPGAAHGRARGLVPGRRGLAYGAETDLRLAQMDHDPFGARVGRICNRRCSPLPGARFANRGMGACRQERTRGPR
jgi:hypothetical protein